MIRAGSCLGLVVAALLTTSVGAREWTDSAGRKTTAEFVRIHKDDVILLRGKKTLKVPYSGFCAADQEFIKSELEAKGLGHMVPQPGSGFAAGAMPGMAPGGMPAMGAGAMPAMGGMPAMGPGMMPPAMPAPGMMPGPGMGMPNMAGPGMMGPGPGMGAPGPINPFPGAMGAQAGAFPPAMPHMGPPMGGPAIGGPAIGGPAMGGPGPMMPHLAMPPAAMPNMAGPGLNNPAMPPDASGAMAGMSYSPAMAPMASPVMPMMTEYKACSACSREVPSHLKAGDRCPHCNVYFGSETMANGQTVQAPVSSWANSIGSSSPPDNSGSGFSVRPRAIGGIIKLFVFLGAGIGAVAGAIFGFVKKFNGEEA